jgi:hypothetical protein
MCAIIVALSRRRRANRLLGPLAREVAPVAAGQLAPSAATVLPNWQVSV